jgi:hypothetical protein
LFPSLQFQAPNYAKTQFCAKIPANSTDKKPRNLGQSSPLVNLTDNNPIFAVFLLLQAIFHSRPYTPKL